MTKRTLPLMVLAPTGTGALKCCQVMTAETILTVQLPEGHFAAVVTDRPDLDGGSIQILDRAEVEAHIELLRNAIEDAERLDAGLPPVHIAPTGTRQ